MPLVKEGVPLEGAELLPFAPTQIQMMVHAIWVNSEREEERRRRERTCKYCHHLSVIDGKCSEENCKKTQPQTAKIRAGGAVYEVIEWPPGSGRRYHGDAKKNAMQKLKEADLQGYVAYNMAMMRGQRP